ncbi:MAG: LysM peptidoglycan-binding domain-containing protein, partial [Chloroflexota bacterium]
DVPTEAPTEAATATEVEADAQQADATPTEEEVAITVVPPTETPLPLIQVTNTPTNTPVPPTATIVPPTTATTVPPSPTAVDAQAADETEEASMTEADATEETGVSQQAPQGPSGPVEIVTSTPISTPTTAPPASDLQPTPTAIGETGAAADDEDDPETASLTAGGEGCSYTVRAGDNAFRIAVNNNITLDELRAANPDQIVGANPIIQPGDVLEIPGCGLGTATSTPQPSPTPTDAPEDLAEPDDDVETVDAPDGFIEYTVSSGDTLLSIARRFGSTVNDLVEANNLTNPDQLSIGQVLFVPDPNADN